MKMTPEQMKKRLKEFESMCICGNCPTYLGLGEEDDHIVYCFPTRGKSKKIKDEVSCICKSCPVYEEMNFATDFFCTRGTEEQQKKVRSKG
jgi:hypothetical protein